MILASAFWDIAAYIVGAFWACYIGFWIADVRERGERREADRRRYLRLVEESVERGHPVPAMPSELAHRRHYFKDIVLGPLLVATAAGLIVYALTRGG